MGQSFDGAPPGLPEFFVTDVRIEFLPGDCVRAVFLHPVEGEILAVIVPLTCWLEMRLKTAQALMEHGKGKELVVVAH